jgi:hypothetical protein
MSPNSIRSQYVNFEIGARWARDGLIDIILMGDIRPESLISPLQRIKVLNGSVYLEIQEFLETLSSNLKLKLNSISHYEIYLNQFNRLSSDYKGNQFTEDSIFFQKNVAKNSGKILTPTSMQLVPQRIVVTGNLDSLNPEYRPWLVVRTAHKQLYPSTPLPRKLGEWKGEVGIGRPGKGNDNSQEYTILLAALGIDANYTYEKYQRGEHPNSDGLGEIQPNDMVIIDEQTVIRTS